MDNCGTGKTERYGHVTECVEVQRMSTADDILNKLKDIATFADRLSTRANVKLDRICYRRPMPNKSVPEIKSCSPYFSEAFEQLESIADSLLKIEEVIESVEV